MFNKLRLKEFLSEYKKSFLSTQWNDEKYKWEAVKCFQENWNVNSDNFAEMLEKSLSKTKNLLASVNNFPAGMITKFAETACEEVRAMFIGLYDENKDVYERIRIFRRKSDILLEKYGNGAAKHYQNENAISTYLWLKYPDKYYIYKPGEVKIVSDCLESSYVFKKGSASSFVLSYNIHNFFQFYNEICAELNQDMELKNLLASQITENCYPDTELKTLTVDVGFFISKCTDKKRFSTKSEKLNKDSKSENNEIIIPSEKQNNEYKKEDFLKEVYMTEAE